MQQKVLVGFPQSAFTNANIDHNGIFSPLSSKLFHENIYV